MLLLLAAGVQAVSILWTTWIRKEILSLLEQISYGVMLKAFFVSNYIANFTPASIGGLLGEPVWHTVIGYLVGSLCRCGQVDSLVGVPDEVGRWCCQVDGGRRIIVGVVGSAGRQRHDRQHDHGEGAR